MPSKKPFSGWDPDGELEVLAAETESHYYSLDRSPFQQFPASLEQRCWAELRREPGHKAAAEILFNVHRARLEETGEMAHASGLKQLQDAVGRDGLSPLAKYGNALINHFQLVLRRGMAKHGVSQSDFENNPMRGVEEAFGTDEGGAEDHLLAGLVQAGYRGLVADDPDMTPYAIALGLREADHFFRAGQPDLAEASLEWSDRRLADLGDALPSRQRQMVGQLYKAAAIGARDARHFDPLIALLERAKSFFPARGNDYAECLFELGQEHERRGNLYEAVSRYEEALGVPSLDDPRLIGVIQACRGTLMADAEGDVARMLPLGRESLEAFGEDPDFVKLIHELGPRLQAGETLTDDELLDAIQVLRRLLASWQGESRSHDRVLSLYVVMLKLGLSVERKDRLPFAFADVLSAAEQFLPGARSGTALEYEQVKAAVEELAPPVPSAPRLPELGRLPRLADVFEQHLRRRPPGPSDR